MKKVLFSALFIFLYLLGAAHAEQYVATKITEIKSGRESGSDIF